MSLIIDLSPKALEVGKLAAKQGGLSLKKMVETVLETIMGGNVAYIILQPPPGPEKYALCKAAIDAILNPKEKKDGNTETTQEAEANSEILSSNSLIPFPIRRVPSVEEPDNGSGEPS